MPAKARKKLFAAKGEIFNFKMVEFTLQTRLVKFSDLIAIHSSTQCKGIFVFLYACD